MIGLLVIIGVLALRLFMYVLAFPEVSAFLLLSVGVLFPGDGIPIFDPVQGAGQLSPFEVIYPFAQFVNTHILPLHPALRILFILASVALYLLLTKIVHIKGFYVIQVAGVLLIGYLSFLAMSKGFNLDLIWSIVLTLVITILAAGMRYSVLNPSMQ